MTIKKNSKHSRLLCLLLAVLLCVAAATPLLNANAASVPTSLGLAEHGIMAHNDGWKYVYAGKGQTISGNVRGSDCAGLIYSYFSDCGAIGSCYGGASGQVNYNCVFSNDISEGIPRIHGLVLTMPDFYSPETGLYGHIGIYIGNNEATDNSDTNYNMRREPVVGSGRNWTAWHIFDNGMKYPINGWYEFDGKMVHYTSYEYDVNTVVDGYAIGADGFALAENGTYAAVDSTLLSSKYVSASQVAAYLGTKYSGTDSTYDIIYGGVSSTPDHEYNGKITGSGVRLRAQANTSSTVLTTMAKGSGVDILDEVAGESVTSNGQTSDKWYSVTAYNGISGYVSALFVQRVEVSALSAPVITAENGYVSITAQDGADIYYTTDGTAPSDSSTPYTEPVFMAGYTYKAIACKNGRTSPVATATVMSNSAVFTDVFADQWYFSDVDRAVLENIFQGNGNGTFSPNKKITRAQFVTVLANLARADLSSYTESTVFTDVTDMTNKMNRAIAWAYSFDLINGFSDGTFRPNETITREQMCSIIAAYAGLERSEDSVEFADDAQIAGWAKDAVYACRDNGLINGIGQNKFNPKGTATRAQACTVSVNLYDFMAVYF